MGPEGSRLWDRFLGRSDTKVLLLGLDAAGKTTLLYRLNPDQTQSPTLRSFFIETLQYRNISFVCWDASLNPRYLVLYRQFFTEAKAVIYMVDSLDRDRIAEARETLEWILGPEELIGAVLLVLGNKQDLPGAMHYSELEEQLALKELRGRQWRLQLCSVITLEGLAEGLDWLSSVLARRASLVLPTQ